jgi:hypothetical protein
MSSWPTRKKNRADVGKLLIHHGIETRKKAENRAVSMDGDDIQSDGRF